MQQCEHAWCRSLGMLVGWLGTPRVALWRCGAGEENAGECGSPDLTGDVLFCAAAATSGSRRLQCSDGGARHCEAVRWRMEQTHGLLYAVFMVTLPASCSPSVYFRVLQWFCWSKQTYITFWAR